MLFLSASKLITWQANSVYIYDPMFTGEEKEILLQHKIELITVNEVKALKLLNHWDNFSQFLSDQEGKRKVARDTLFYMPHAGKRLYSNLLWANWGISLHHVSIYGNSFARYDEQYVIPTLIPQSAHLMYRHKDY